MTTVEKILKYLDSKGISKREFYRLTGISNGFLDKTKNIGSDNLAKIFSIYKDLNRDWLLMDEGDMIVQPQTPYPQNIKVNSVHEANVDYNLQHKECTSCMEKDKTIRTQQITIEALQQTSKAQSDLIENLKQKINELSSK